MYLRHTTRRKDGKVHTHTPCPAGSAPQNLVANGYKKWWGQKALVWFAPPRAAYAQHGVEVIINPELGLDINGARHLVKLYFKTEPLSKLRVDNITRLMESTLRSHCQKNEVMAVLDVRESKLFSFHAAAATSMAMIDAELAYVGSLWPHV